MLSLIHICYVVTSVIDHFAASAPASGKQVAVETGAWFKNFNENPALWAFPVLAVVGALLNVVASKANRCGFAFFFSVLTMAGVIITAAVSMFPFVMQMCIRDSLETAPKLLRLIDMLEDCDDVQNVYHNGEISDEVAAQL